MSRGVYYNENDPQMAAWLRELVKAGLIAPGFVDERSIVEVKGSDLEGYAQCHFFAGIGGWSYALRLAGWRDDRGVWTGSCPCQPFSCAGKRKGKRDRRHLWPEFRRLIGECKPAVVFGEQVAGKAGRLWFSGVRGDVEALGYAAGAADLCAAGVSAPHLRQRIYWVADGAGNGWGQGGADFGGSASGGGAARKEGNGFADDGAGFGGVAIAGQQSAGRGDTGQGEGVGAIGKRAPGEFGGSSGVGGVVHAARGGRATGKFGTASARYGGAVESAGGVGGMADAAGDGREQRREAARVAVEAGSEGAGSEARGELSRGFEGLRGAGDGLGESQGEQVGDAGFARGRSEAGCGGEFDVWGGYELVWCADGKWRRFEPGSFPLVDGVPERVGLLRGYGNAIVPEVAAEFIIAYCEALACRPMEEAAA